MGQQHISFHLHLRHNIRIPESLHLVPVFLFCWVSNILGVLDLTGAKLYRILLYILIVVLIVGL